MQKIEISARTIVFTVFFILGLFFVWMIRDLLFSLLIGFILMSALKPVVKKLEGKGMPHGFSVVAVYLVFLLLIVLLISLIIPPIVIEISNLAKSFPLIVENLQTRLGDWVQVETVSQYLPNVTNNLFQVVSGIFTNILFVITTLVFGFYFLLEENAMKKFFLPYVSKTTESRVIAILDRAEMRMSQWFWGQFVLMVAVGTMTGIGLSLIGVKYVLALAVLAGILEAVPTIGPTIAAIPAVIIGFSQSYLTGFSALAVAVIVQQVENNFLVPIVMRRAVGINPMVTLIALVIGGKIGGVLGVLLAVPTFLFIESIVLELIKQPTAVNPAVKKR